jgi:virginiamycin B lyase
VKERGFPVESAIRSRPKPIIREHRIPTRDSKPYIAVEGPDGNLWFCESGTSKIGCLDTRSGMFVEFDLPSAESTPIGIDVGADGNLWFTEKTGNRIGWLSPKARWRNLPYRPPILDPMELPSGRTETFGFLPLTSIGWAV